MRRTSLVLFLSLLVLASRAVAVEPLKTHLTPDDIDVENCEEFPDNPDAFRYEKRRSLLGLLHIRGPMLPHTHWRTGRSERKRVHLRVCFTRQVKLGTVIGGGGWTVSLLRDETDYPGDVEDDSQWESVPEVPGQAGLRVLPLPEVTTTRAVRLTKTRRLEKDQKQKPRLAGLVLLKERLHTLTPEATAFASSEAVSNQKEREQRGVQNLIDGGQWVANRGETISPEHPQWVVLSWDRPVRIDALGLLNAFAKRVEFDVFTGPASVHPVTAAEDQWEHVGGGNPPVWWRPAYTDCYFRLEEPRRTRALRLRITRPLTDENADIRRVAAGKANFTRLAGLMVMTDLGEEPVPARPGAETEKPPVEISYRMPFDGKVAVAINDADGNRVRNLIADTPRQEGQQVVRWDGLDDEGNPVTPGTYTVKTLSHRPLSLKYQMTPNNARDLPWWPTSSWGWQEGPGSFLSDHAPPLSVCTLGDRVYVGAYIAESGHSLAVLDLEGNKVAGTKWIETAGAARLATDGKSIFVAAEGGWIRRRVMIFRLDPETYKHKRLVQFTRDRAAGRSGGLSGLAAREGRIYAAFNSPKRAWTASALSGSNIDPEACFPEGLGKGRHTDAGALAALLRAGGQPSPHHSLQPETAGERQFLRIAFKQPQPIGSILLPACGAEFAALRADAEYPGDVQDDAQWRRLTSETTGRVQLVAPSQGLTTRAIRLSWAKESKRAMCPGLKILGHRFGNLTDSAKVSATSGTVGKGGRWSSERRPADRPISLSDPEALTLRWEEPREVRALALIDPFAARIVVEVKRPGAEWAEAGTMDPPVWWRPSYHDAYLDLGRTMTIVGLRLRVVKALAAQNADVRRRTGGEPVLAGIGGVAVLRPLGDEPELPPDLSQRISVYSAEDGSLQHNLTVDEPRGLAFDTEGRLLAVSAGQIVEVDPATGKTRPLISDHLEDPHDLTVADDGTIYVTDGAPSHQVKVFDPDGEFRRTLGRAGGRTAGPYRPEHMHDPRGIDIDRRGQVWVAEHDRQPKRISWWQADTGEVVGTKMGPTRYGGGGFLDPQNKERFYYRGMEFRLDWEEGTWHPANILWRGAGVPGAPPERPVHRGGRRFLVADPGHQYGAFAKVAEIRGQVAVPLALAGPAEKWKILERPEFQKQIGANLTNRGVIWVDRNGDARPQPDEVELGRKLSGAYFTSFMGEDLTLNFRRIQIPADGFNDCGAPRYSFDNDVSRAELPVDGTYSTARLPDGSIFGVTSPIALVSPDDELQWTYPEDYLGVHASHRAPRPKTGECSGSLLYIGRARGTGEVEELLGMVSNFGYYTLFTRDGMHAARLFHDHRTGAPGWHTPTARRGMEVGHMTLGGEHFYGSFTRTSDGKYYVVAGHNHSSIVEVEGLESLTRSRQEIEFTPEDFAACERYNARRELASLKKEKPRFMRAPRIGEFRADGKPGEWGRARPAKIASAGAVRMAWTGTDLVMAWEVRDATPLLNRGERPAFLFKTGDSVNLHIATDPDADPERMAPARGDLRLLITRREEKILGVLYRYRVPGMSKDEATFFSSPWRTVRVDEVKVLRDLRSGWRKTRKGYVLEVAVPLEVLGLRPEPGLRVGVDFGILLGDETGRDTRERLYWSNPATTLISDIPSEIKITPALWGTVEFGE